MGGKVASAQDSGAFIDVADQGGEMAPKEEESLRQLVRDGRLWSDTLGGALNRLLAILPERGFIPDIPRFYAAFKGFSASVRPVDAPQGASGVFAPDSSVWHAAPGTTTLRLVSRGRGISHSFGADRVVLTMCAATVPTEEEGGSLVVVTRAGDGPDVRVHTMDCDFDELDAAETGWVDVELGAAEFATISASPTRGMAVLTTKQGGVFVLDLAGGEEEEEEEDGA